MTSTRGIKVVEEGLYVFFLVVHWDIGNSALWLLWTKRLRKGTVGDIQFLRACCRGVRHLEQSIFFFLFVSWEPN